MKPYQPASLPLSDLNWKALVPLIGQAQAGLARYDGTLQGIVNSYVLLAPLSTQEAVLSSRIEGTVSTLEEVLRFEALGGEKTERADEIREILNYRNAMHQAVQLMEKRPINLNMVKHVHSELLDSVRGQDKSRGRFRDRQNWIGNPDSPIEQARFVPPAPLFLMEHLSNLEKYIHYDEIDRLVQLAVVHAQFELIHPFIDGNGRVGRILIPLFLFEKKLLSQPTFYLSAYLEAHRDAYYDKLQAISDRGDWQGWIEFFLTAVIEQAIKNTAKAKEIIELYNQMKIRFAETTHSQFAIKALDSIFYQPFFSSRRFFEHSGIPKGSATRILKALVKEKLLRILEQGGGRRPATYFFLDLLKITGA
ncbi:MAG: Fic family protein [Planctomycetes bacterium]|nr:Fic family protein [Planctomycetota bacterium]